MLSDGVRTAYQEGKGSITVRGRAHIEDEMQAPPAKSGGKRKGPAAKSRTGAQKPLVVITELPYQVNKVGQQGCKCTAATRSPAWARLLHQLCAAAG